MKLVNARFVLVLSALSLAACGKVPKEKESSSADAAAADLVEIPVSIESSQLGLAGGDITKASLKVTCGTASGYTNMPFNLDWVGNATQSIKVPAGAASCSSVLTSVTIASEEYTSTNLWVSLQDASREIKIVDIKTFTAADANIQYSYTMLNREDAASVQGQALGSKAVTVNILGNYAPNFAPVAISGAQLGSADPVSGNQKVSFTIKLQCQDQVLDQNGVVCRDDIVSVMDYKLFAAEQDVANLNLDQHFSPIAAGSYLADGSLTLSVESPIVWQSGATTSMYMYLRTHAAGQKSYTFFKIEFAGTLAP